MRKISVLVMKRIAKGLRPCMPADERKLRSMVLGKDYIVSVERSTGISHYDMYNALVQVISETLRKSILNGRFERAEGHLLAHMGKCIHFHTNRGSRQAGKAIRYFEKRYYYVKFPTPANIDRDWRKFWPKAMKAAEEITGIPEDELQERVLDVLKQESTYTKIKKALGGEDEL